MKQYKSFLDKKIKNDNIIISLKEEKVMLLQTIRLDEDKMQFINKNDKKYVIIMREFKKRMNRKRERIALINREIKKYETL